MCIIFYPFILFVLFCFRFFFLSLNKSEYLFLVDVYGHPGLGESLWYTYALCITYWFNHYKKKKTKKKPLFLLNVINRKYTHWWSTVPPISTKQSPLATNDWAERDGRISGWKYRFWLGIVSQRWRPKPFTVIHLTWYRQLVKWQPSHGTVAIYNALILNIIHNIFNLRYNMILFTVSVMVCNVTFNTISVISWQSVLLVEETRGLGEDHRPVESHWQTWSRDALSSTHRHERGSNSQL